MSSIGEYSFEECPNLKTVITHAATYADTWAMEKGLTVNYFHYYDDWKLSKVPTCFVEGQETRQCSYCGETEYRELEKLVHQYGDWLVVKGSKLIPPIVSQKTCGLCGDVQIQEDWSYRWISILCICMGSVVLAAGIVTGIVILRRKRK